MKGTFMTRCKYVLILLGIFALNYSIQLFLLFLLDFKLMNIITIILLVIYMLSSVGLTIWIAQKFKILGHDLRPVKKYISWIFLGFGVVFLNNILGAILLNLEGATTTANQASVESITQRAPMVIMALLIMVVAPVMEEVLCRGIIPNLIFKDYEKIGYIIATLLFALLHHPTSLGSWVIYGGVSAVLAFLAYKSKHLEVSIALHVLINTIVFILIKISP